MAFGQLIDQRKLNKRNHVVELFRSEGPLSKARVRQISGYSMDTLISVFKNLVESGYIKAVEPADSGGGAEGGEPPLPGERPRGEGERRPDGEPALRRAKGRPAELYRLDDERELYLGITFHLGGIFSALVSFSGATLDMRRDALPALEDQASFEAAFTSHFLGFLAANSVRIPQIKRVGLALPGQYDPERGVLIHYGLMPFLKDLDLGSIIGRHLAGAPILCRHNVAGLARYLLGDKSLGGEFHRILYVTARAGAAHALIQDGKIVLDEGEMGHLRVHASKLRCDCGRTGCLDTLFSSRVIRGRFRGATWESIGGALRSEEPAVAAAAKRKVDPSFRAFGEALLDLCASFSPDLVMLSGELFALLPDPVPWIRAWLGEQLDLDRPPAWFPKEIRYRSAGSEAAAIGLCNAMIEDEWAWQTG